MARNFCGQGQRSQAQDVTREDPSRLTWNRPKGVMLPTVCGGAIHCSLVFRVAAPQRCLEELSFVPEQGCPESCSLFLALPQHPTLPTHSCHKHTGTHPTPGHAKGSSGLEVLLLPLPLPLVFYSSPLTLLFECWPSLAILGILG